MVQFLQYGGERNHFMKIMFKSHQYDYNNHCKFNSADCFYLLSFKICSSICIVLSATVGAMRSILCLKM